MYIKHFEDQNILKIRFKISDNHTGNSIGNKFNFKGILSIFSISNDHNSHSWQDRERKISSGMQAYKF